MNLSNSRRSVYGYGSDLILWKVRELERIGNAGNWIAPLLATQTASAVSALDGIVTFCPASIRGVAINLGRSGRHRQRQYPDHPYRAASINNNQFRHMGKHL